MLPLSSSTRRPDHAPLWSRPQVWEKRRPRSSVLQTALHRRQRQREPPLQVSVESIPPHACPGVWPGPITYNPAPHSIHFFFPPAGQKIWTSGEDPTKPPAICANYTDFTCMFGLRRGHFICGVLDTQAGGLCVFISLFPNKRQISHKILVCFSIRPFHFCGDGVSGM